MESSRFGDLTPPFLVISKSHYPSCAIGAFVKRRSFVKDDTTRHETSSKTNKGWIYDPRPRERNCTSWARGPLVVLTKLGTFGMGVHSNNVHNSCPTLGSIVICLHPNPFALINGLDQIFIKHIAVGLLLWSLKTI